MGRSSSCSPRPIRGSGNRVTGPRMTDTSLYFCVDAGGTRSRARIIDREGRFLAEAASGPCHPATHFDKAVESITDLWGQCAAAIGRRGDQSSGVVFAIGAAGTYLHGRDRFLAAFSPLF